MIKDTEVLTRIETKQEIMLEDLTIIKRRMENNPCKVNTFKINLMQKIVYGFIIIILMAFMSDVIKLGAGTKNDIKNSEIGRKK